MTILAKSCRAAFFAASLLLFHATPAQPAELSREQAVRQLANGDAQMRHGAVLRLGEVGVMADVKPLVAALRDPDEGTREDAEQALWRIWSRSGDREIDALYKTGIDQMQGGALQDAIGTFSRIIARKPGFAEGWNKRATLYFLTGDLRKSLADCDEVIKRNPYHFGALSGYAQIYTRLEYYDRALDYSRRALAINPNLEGVQRSIEMLEQMVAQRRKQMI